MIHTSVATPPLELAIHLSYTTTYCCFLWAAGPISLSNEPYETCKLDRAVKPTYRMLSRTKRTTKLMNTPGVKNWYFSKSGSLSDSLACRLPTNSGSDCLFSSMWAGFANSAWYDLNSLGLEKYRMV